MTEEELSELDDWITMHFLNWTVDLNQNATDRPRWSSDPAAFDSVKFAIKHRGWGWRSQYYATRKPDEPHYLFSIFMPHHEPVQGEWAETEELAGCLAVKRAFEALQDARQSRPRGG